MDKIKPQIKTRLIPISIIIPFIVIAVLFFFSPNAGRIWPIGVLLLGLIFYYPTIGHFYDDHLVIVRPFIFIKQRIEYKSILKVNEAPFFFAPLGIGVHYKNKKGKIKKVGFDSDVKSYILIKKLVSEINADVKFTRYGEKIK